MERRWEEGNRIAVEGRDLLKKFNGLMKTVFVD